MRPLFKAGLVVAGYVVAIAIAFGIVAIYVAVTNGPDRQDSSGMYAFGDSLLFLAVFGVAASPPTGAALFFLKPYRSFWIALSFFALGIASTSLAALVVFVATRTADALSILHSWSPLAVLRVLVAPLFAMAFLLAGLFSPARSFRIALLIAAGVEALVFTYVAVIWLHSFQSH